MTPLLAHAQHHVTEEIGEVVGVGAGGPRVASSLVIGEGEPRRQQQSMLQPMAGELEPGWRELQPVPKRAPIMDGEHRDHRL